MYDSRWLINILLISALILTLITFILLIIVGINPQLLKNQVLTRACTQEAKLCPDGSSVGRTGPNCEFAECPSPKIIGGEKDAHGCLIAAGYSWCEQKQKCLRTWEERCADTDVLINTTDQNGTDGYEFKYPKNFGGNVWSAPQWPPKTTVVPVSQDPIVKGCPDLQGGLPVEKKGVTLNNIKYSLSTSSGGAAGSTYTTYCYVTQKDQKYYIIEFLIRYTSGCGENCGPYCGTQFENECKNFDKLKEVETPIDQILSTFKFIE